MNKRCIFFLLFFIAAVTSAQDTSAVRRDSIVIVHPVPEVGSIDPFGGDLGVLSGRDLIWKDYRSLYDILSGEYGIVIRDLASPGQKNQIMINGINDSNIGILVDGVPYNDEFSSSFNLWNIPVNMIERIEIVTGPGSLFYDGRSSGGVINIVTKNFTNNRAMTQLHYSQGVDGYVHTDAMFAQNILRGFNVSLGLTHHGYGTNKEASNFRGRFYNSNDDAWGFRAKARYDINDVINVSFSHIFNRTWTGLHGGVNYNTSPSIFDGYQADVENLDSYEKLFYSQSLLTIAIAPSQDSSNIFSVTGFYFDRVREYRDEENRFPSNGIFEQLNYSSISQGIKAQYYNQSGFNRIIVTYQYKDVGPGSQYRWESVGIKDRIQLLQFFDATGFVSYFRKLSYGAEGTLRLGNHFSLFGGYSNNAGPTTADRGLLSTRNETIESAEGGMRWLLTDTFEGKISVTRHVMNNPITFDTVSAGNDYFAPQQFTYDGLSAYAHVTYGSFHAVGSGQYLIQPKIVRESISLTLFPEIVMSGSVYFHGLLANGNLDLKAGVRGSYTSSQTGMRPYDRTGDWIPSSLLSFGPSGTMDLFAIGKIGDAYVHLIWENITGNQYLLAPVYPMYDRNIRFGVTWEFLD